MSVAKTSPGALTAGSASSVRTSHVIAGSAPLESAPTSGLVKSEKCIEHFPPSPYSQRQDVLLYTASQLAQDCQREQLIRALHGHHLRTCGARQLLYVPFLLAQQDAESLGLKNPVLEQSSFLDGTFCLLQPSVGAGNHGCRKVALLLRNIKVKRFSAFRSSSYGSLHLSIPPEVQFFLQRLGQKFNVAPPQDPREIKVRCELDTHGVPVWETHEVYLRDCPSLGARKNDVDSASPSPNDLFRTSPPAQQPPTAVCPPFFPAPSSPTAPSSTQYDSVAAPVASKRCHQKDVNTAESHAVAAEEVSSTSSSSSSESASQTVEDNSGSFMAAIRWSALSNRGSKKKKMAKDQSSAQDSKSGRPEGVIGASDLDSWCHPPSYSSLPADEKHQQTKRGLVFTHSSAACHVNGEETNAGEVTKRDDDDERSGSVVHESHIRLGPYSSPNEDIFTDLKKLCVPGQTTVEAVVHLGNVCPYQQSNFLILFLRELRLIRTVAASPITPSKPPQFLPENTFCDASVVTTTPLLKTFSPADQLRPPSVSFSQDSKHDGAASASNTSAQAKVLHGPSCSQVALDGTPSGVQKIGDGAGREIDPALYPALRSPPPSFPPPPSFATLDPQYLNTQDNYCFTGRSLISRPPNFEPPFDTLCQLERHPAAITVPRRGSASETHRPLGALQDVSCPSEQEAVAPHSSSKETQLTADRRPQNCVWPSPQQPSPKRSPLAALPDKPTYCFSDLYVSEPVSSSFSAVASSGVDSALQLVSLPATNTFVAAGGNLAHSSFASRAGMPSSWYNCHLRERSDSQAVALNSSMGYNYAFQNGAYLPNKPLYDAESEAQISHSLYTLQNPSFRKTPNSVAFPNDLISSCCFENDVAPCSGTNSASACQHVCGNPSSRRHSSFSETKAFGTVQLSDPPRETSPILQEEEKRYSLPFKPLRDPCSAKTPFIQHASDTVQQNGATEFSSSRFTAFPNNKQQCPISSHHISSASEAGFPHTAQANDHHALGPTSISSASPSLVSKPLSPSAPWESPARGQPTTKTASSCQDAFNNCSGTSCYDSSRPTENDEQTATLRRPPQPEPSRIVCRYEITDFLHPRNVKQRRMLKSVVAKEAAAASRRAAHRLATLNRTNPTLALEDVQELCNKELVTTTDSPAEPLEDGVSVGKEEEGLIGTEPLGLTSPGETAALASEVGELFSDLSALPPPEKPVVFGGAKQSVSSSSNDYVFSVGDFVEIGKLEGRKDILENQTAEIIAISQASNEEASRENRVYVTVSLCRADGRRFQGQHNPIREDIPTRSLRLLEKAECRGYESSGKLRPTAPGVKSVTKGNADFFYPGAEPRTTSSHMTVSSLSGKTVGSVSQQDIASQQTSTVSDVSATRGSVGSQYALPTSLGNANQERFSHSLLPPLTELSIGKPAVLDGLSSRGHAVATAQRSDVSFERLQPGTLYAHQSLVATPFTLCPPRTSEGVLCFFWDLEATGLHIQSDDITQIACVCRRFYFPDVQPETGRALETNARSTASYTFLDQKRMDVAQETHIEQDTVNQGNWERVAGYPEEQFNCYVYTDRPIPEPVVQLTGITNEFLDKQGVPFNQAIEAWSSWISSARERYKNCPVWFVAHNGNRYDLPLLFQQEVRKLGQPPGTFLNAVGAVGIVDTVVLSRRLPWGELGRTRRSHKLHTLYFDVFHEDMPNEHDALGDVEGLAALMDQEPFLFAWSNIPVGWNLTEYLHRSNFSRFFPQIYPDTLLDVKPSAEQVMGCAALGGPTLVGSGVSTLECTNKAQQTKLTHFATGRSTVSNHSDSAAALAPTAEFDSSVSQFWSSQRCLVVGTDGETAKPPTIHFITEELQHERQQHSVGPTALFPLPAGMSSFHRRPQALMPAEHFYRHPDNTVIACSQIEKLSPLPSSYNPGPPYDMQSGTASPSGWRYSRQRGAVVAVPAAAGTAMELKPSTVVAADQASRGPIPEGMRQLSSPLTQTDVQGSIPPQPSIGSQFGAPSLHNATHIMFQELSSLETSDNRRPYWDTTTAVSTGGKHATYRHIHRSVDTTAIFPRPYGDVRHQHLASSVPVKTPFSKTFLSCNAAPLGLSECCSRTSGTFTATGNPLSYEAGGKSESSRYMAAQQMQAHQPFGIAQASASQYPLRGASSLSHHFPLSVKESCSAFSQENCQLMPKPGRLSPLPSSQRTVMSFRYTDQGNTLSSSEQQQQHHWEQAKDLNNNSMSHQRRLQAHGTSHAIVGGYTPPPWPVPMGVHSNEPKASEAYQQDSSSMTQTKQSEALRAVPEGTTSEAGDSEILEDKARQSPQLDATGHSSVGTSGISQNDRHQAQKMQGVNGGGSFVYSMGGNRIESPWSSSLPYRSAPMDGKQPAAAHTAFMSNNTEKLNLLEQNETKKATDSFGSVSSSSHFLSLKAPADLPRHRALFSSCSFAPADWNNTDNVCLPDYRFTGNWVFSDAQNPPRSTPSGNALQNYQETPTVPLSQCASTLRYGTAPYTNVSEMTDQEQQMRNTTLTLRTTPDETDSDARSQMNANDRKLSYASLGNLPRHSEMQQKPLEPPLTRQPLSVGHTSETFPKSSNTWDNNASTLPRLMQSHPVGTAPSTNTQRLFRSASSQSGKSKGLSIPTCWGPRAKDNCRHITSSSSNGTTAEFDFTYNSVINSGHPAAPSSAPSLWVPRTAAPPRPATQQNSKQLLTKQIIKRVAQPAALSQVTSKPGLALSSASSSTFPTHVEQKTENLKNTSSSASLASIASRSGAGIGTSGLVKQSTSLYSGVPAAANLRENENSIVDVPYPPQTNASSSARGELDTEQFLFLADQTAHKSSQNLDHDSCSNSHPLQSSPCVSGPRSQAAVSGSGITWEEKRQIGYRASEEKPPGAAAMPYATTTQQPPDQKLSSSSIYAVRVPSERTSSTAGWSLRPPCYNPTAQHINVPCTATNTASLSSTLPRESTRALFSGDANQKNSAWGSNTSMAPRNFNTLDSCAQPFGAPRVVNSAGSTRNNALGTEGVSGSFYGSRVGPVGKATRETTKMSNVSPSPLCDDGQLPSKPTNFTYRKPQSCATAAVTASSGASMKGVKILKRGGNTTTSCVEKQPDGKAQLAAAIAGVAYDGRTTTKLNAVASEVHKQKAAAAAVQLPSGNQTNELSSKNISTPTTTTTTTPEKPVTLPASSNEKRGAAIMPSQGVASLFGTSVPREKCASTSRVTSPTSSASPSTPAVSEPKH